MAPSFTKHKKLVAVCQCLFWQVVLFFPLCSNISIIAGVNMLIRGLKMRNTVCVHQSHLHTSFSTVKANIWTVGTERKPCNWAEGVWFTTIHDQESWGADWNLPPKCQPCSPFTSRPLQFPNTTDSQCSSKHTLNNFWSPAVCLEQESHCCTC